MALITQDQYNTMQWSDIAKMLGLTDYGAQQQWARQQAATSPLDSFMNELRNNPMSFQAIADDGGNSSVYRIGAGGDPSGSGFSLNDILKYEYPDLYKASYNSGDGSGFSTSYAGNPTEAQARADWAKTMAARSGISFEDMLKRTGATVGPDGRITTPTTPTDFGFGGGGGFGEFLKYAVPFMLGGASLGTALGGELGGGLASVTGIENPATWGNLDSLTSLGEAAAGAGASDLASITGIEDLSKLGNLDSLTNLGDGIIDKLPENLGNVASVDSAGLENLDKLPDFTKAADPLDELLNPTKAADGLTSGSYVSNADIINNVSSGLGDTIPGYDGLQKIISGLTGPTGLASTASSASWFKPLLDTLSKNGPAGQGIAALLNYFTNSDNARYLANTFGDIANKADPFADQRPFYKNQLKAAWTDPNYWSNNAILKGVSDLAMSDSQRADAAAGIHASTNVLSNIAQRSQKEQMKYAPTLLGQLAQQAGAGISPGIGAGIQAQGAQLATQANNSANTQLGNVIGALPDIINQVQKILP